MDKIIYEVSEPFTPDSVIGYEKASQYAEKAGDYASALQFHEKRIGIEGLSYFNCLRAAGLHFKSEGYRMALRYYKTAASCKPNALEPILGAMDCCVAMGSSDEAGHFLKIAIRRWKTALPNAEAD